MNLCCGVAAESSKKTRPSVKKNEDCSLSDGMRQLGREQKLRAFDIGDAHWHDVDSPEALVHAESIFDRDFCENPLAERLVRV